jgi:hypothetical protein
MSVEKLREELKKYTTLSGNTSDIEAFVGRVQEWNNNRIKNADLTSLLCGKKYSEIVQKAEKVNFMLAVDPTMPWIRECTI